MFYVLEGSTLGSQLLAAHFERLLAVRPHEGGTFFSGYGAATGSMWRAFRERADLRELARASLADLRARGLVDWMDPEDVYRRHQARQGQHADALIVLTSLEIHHKAREAAAAPAAGADTTHRITTHR